MRWIAFAALTSLAGCGAVYISPSVQENASAEDGQSVVDIVTMSRASIAQANSVPYRPRQLPSAFYSGNGQGRMARAPAPVPEGVEAEQTRPPLPRTTPLPQLSPTAYEIGIGDVVLLSTTASGSTVQELSGLLAAQSKRAGYTVQDDGAIAIPDVGRVRLAGLTLDQAEAAIFEALVNNSVDPVFSLEISEFRSQRVAVGGLVQKPSAVPITLQPVTLEDAINAAGGILRASPDYTVIRVYREGRLYQIPLSEYRKDPAHRKSLLLNGDSVYVDSEYDLDAARAYFEEQIRLATARGAMRSQALSEMSAELALRQQEADQAINRYTARADLDALPRDYVYIMGEVGAQTRFTLPFGRQATLADALFSESGGIPTQEGNIGQVYVLRANKTGDRITAYHLNGANVANFVLATKMEMRPNDIVFVSEQPVTKWKRVIDQLMPSLIVTTANSLR